MMMGLSLKALEKFDLKWRFSSLIIFRAGYFSKIKAEHVLLQSPKINNLWSFHRKLKVHRLDL